MKIINYWKQAVATLRTQPLLSAVSIAGTALAIFIIMVVVMMDLCPTKLRLFRYL